MENGDKTVFYIGNKSMSALLTVNYGKLELTHFGAPVKPEDAEAMSCCSRLGWGCDVLYREGDTASGLDTLPLAWSGTGTGDYRETPLEILLDGKSIAPDFVYSGYEIIEGVCVPDERLPHARGAESTLRIEMCPDNPLLSGLRLELYFSLFDTAITRSAVLLNNSDRTVTVSKFMSSCADIKGSWEMTTFDGGWIKEAHTHTVPVSYSRTVNESTNGFSSNRHNPGFVISDEAATEDVGEVFGFNLIWSGNHYSSVGKSAIGFTRILQGINPEGFLKALEPGDSFTTPEAVAVWSGEGFNGMRRAMHSFVNGSVVPQFWQGKERPVLYNSWEGCMFDFNESKLLSLARKAKKLGCELFVLDDGWFGARNDDRAGLGDYSINRKKLPNGIDGLAEKIRGLGMDFGLWFEPEAVNPDSDCYRAHPDWVLKSPGGRELLGRNELLLDLTKKEVRDYIVENVSGIIDKAGIKYVKWDMNRNSPVNGVAAYDYILGLYDIMRRIFEPRPEVLLEGCASGGNRFDLGILCFAPQIWASDNTDPIERLDIQEGLFCLYPQSTVSAHISEAPHSQTLRKTPLSTRANAAFFGNFGIEFDLAHMQAIDEADIREAVDFYKEHRKTFQFGDLRCNRAEEGALCWQVSSEKATICGLFHRLVPAAVGQEWLRAGDLDPNVDYSVTARSQLLRVGQYGGLLKHITPVELNPNGAVVRAADRHYKMRDGGFNRVCSGSALKTGIPLPRRFSGTGYDPEFRMQGDFSSNVFVIEEIKD